MPKQINRVELQGYIGKDPESRITSGGSMVCNFSLATTDRKKNKQTGEWENGDTHWHRIVTWNKTAEWCVDNLSKGDCVNVEGKISYRKHEDKFYTDIIGFHVSAVEHEDKPQPQDDDDIPF